MLYRLFEGHIYSYEETDAAPNHGCKLVRVSFQTQQRFIRPLVALEQHRLGPSIISLAGLSDPLMQINKVNRIYWEPLY